MCPVNSDFHCVNLQESRFILRMSGIMNETLTTDGTTEHLSFEAEAQHSRKAGRVNKKGNKEYGVVAHIGLKNEATALQVEAWIRFHMSRGLKMFLFDRYAFHRDIVAHAMKTWKGQLAVPTEQKYVDPQNPPEGNKICLQPLFQVKRLHQRN